LEDFINWANLVTQGGFLRSKTALENYISQLNEWKSLGYKIYQNFLEYSSNYDKSDPQSRIPFKSGELWKSLKISKESKFHEGSEISDWKSVFTRLIVIYLLKPRHVSRFGIPASRLEDLKTACYNSFLEVLKDPNRRNFKLDTKNKEDLFNIALFSCIIENEGRGGLDTLRSLEDLYIHADLSEVVSDATTVKNKRLFFTNSFRGDHIIRKHRCYKLLDHYKTSHQSATTQKAEDLVKKYLKDNYWLQNIISRSGYHKYFQRSLFKKLLRYETMQATLGLDVYEFDFIETDNGDLIDLHHIFGYKESILFRDLAALETGVHTALSNYERGLSNDDWARHAEKIYLRKARLFELSKLHVTPQNELKIRNEFAKDLWVDHNGNHMPNGIVNEWVERWKDKSVLSPDNWHSKYYMKITLDEYAISVLQLRYMTNSRHRSQRDFANWYLYIYLPYYSSQSENK